MVATSDFVRSTIRSIPDFPKKGIMFRDITTLLQNPTAFAASIDLLYERFRAKRIDKIVGIESRGFIIGGALAYKFGIGFVPVRKPKKLPYQTIREEYQLEYGTDALEIHTDAIQKGEHILIVDDLIATGGTVIATTKLVERLGGTVDGLGFLIELSFLHGRERLKQYEIFSAVSYDSE